MNVARRRLMTAMLEPSARLYLVTPDIQDCAAFAPALDAALSSGAVACVLVRTRVDDAPGLAGLVRQVQARGAAALVPDDPALAAACGADGVHGTAPDGLAALARRVKPAGILGCGGLISRDDAMTAGEAGVDYLMFGEAALERAEPPPLEQRLDRVAWWAEIFEVPGVACAATLAEVAPFAAAGADFVAVSACIWDDPRGIPAAMRDALASLGAAAPRHAGSAVPA